jgi:translation initiation factor IF-2
MAKMRVYELAKELKVDNKELVRQLIEMGLDVRNHMSTITPEEAQSVRDRNKESRSEVVEEKRVTRTVIRRRRKKVEADSGTEQPAEEKEAEAPAEAGQAQEEEAVAAAGAPEAAEEAPPEDAPEPAPESGPEAIVAEAPPQEEAAAPEAAAEFVEEDEEAALPPETEEAPPAEEAPAEEPAALVAEGAAAEPEAEEATAPEAPAGKAAKEPKETDAAQAKPKTVEEPGKKPKPKTKRKLKGDEPARIISRPTQPVAPTLPGGGRPRPAPPSRRPGPPRPQDMAPPPGPSPEKTEGSRKRKKGKKAAPIPDNDFLISKTKSRKKEILNKADLYDHRGSRRKRGAPKKARKTEVTTPKAIKRRVKVSEAITVGELAKRMGVKAAEMVGRLMKQGMMLTLNQSLDIEEATLVANEFGFEVESVGFEEHGLLEKKQDQPEEMQQRPPVVTIMGHVDHGKTSLLDTIRRSDVVGGEAGGITQHIGAYNVRLETGGQVVFVDTPGHEAFTEMRARGSQVTDIVVLVVAADDGVMDQTKEAIAHSKAAGVPIVVAINKIDKPGAEPDRVRRELADLQLVSEDWGGDTIMVEVSAKTGQGVPELLEMLLLQAELLEIAANPDKMARGHILEARLDKGRGPVATLLVQEGTLKNGDAFVCGVYAGKVRALFDDLGRRVDEAGPSIPVEVQGLGGVPEAGDEFVVVESDKAARQIADHRALKKRETELSQVKGVSLEGFFDQLQEGEVKELSLVVKADVQGSVEAVVNALDKLGNEQVKVNVIEAATGAITETNVMLAAASDAIIIGFNVRPAGKVSEVAEAERVDIKTYEVIYQMLDDVTAALTGMLAPLVEEEVIGRVEVRDTFGVPKIGTIAGSYVTSGKVERNAMARLLRDGTVIANTKISSLRRFKDDVKEVAQGFECGIGLENYNDIKLGDEIEVYVTREVAATL